MKRTSAVLLTIAVLVLAVSGALAAQEITLMTWGGDFVPGRSSRSLNRKPALESTTKK